MAIEWTEDLATGVVDIDNQHKELFSRVNALMDACRSGKGKKQVEGTLDFLASYVVEHFATEEKMMRKHEYPKFDEHKAQHVAFMDDVAKLRNEFSNSGADISLVIRTNAAVVDWLLQHIRKTDKLMGGFLKTKV